MIAFTLWTRLLPIRQVFVLNLKNCPLCSALLAIRQQQFWELSQAVGQCRINRRVVRLLFVMFHHVVLSASATSRLHIRNRVVTHPKPDEYSGLALRRGRDISIRSERPVATFVDNLTGRTQCSLACSQASADRRTASSPAPKAASPFLGLRYLPLPGYTKEP